MTRLACDAPPGVELGVLLSNPALSSVEDLHLRQLRDNVPHEPSLWPASLRALRLAFDRRPKDEVVLPPAPELETLNVWGLHLPSLEALSVYPRLKTLSLNGRLASLDGIEALPELRELSIVNHNKRMRDVEPLRGLERLEEVEVDGCDAKTLEPFSAMRHLHKLRIANFPKVKSVEPLLSLDALTDLELMLYAVKVFGPLQQLPKLTKVRLFGKGVWVRSLRDLGVQARKEDKSPAKKKAAKKRAPKKKAAPKKRAGKKRAPAKRR